MEKNTLVAIVLCVIVISAGYFVQAIFFPVDNDVAEKQETVEAVEAEGSSALDVPDQAVETVEMSLAPDPGNYHDVNVETDVFSATFTTKGGSLKSVKLKKHSEKDGQPLEMIYRNASDMNAFELYFGSLNGRPLEGDFSCKKYNVGKDTVVEFSHDVDMLGYGSKVPVEVKKRYTFKPDEYMIELAVEFTSKNGKAVNFNTNGFAYSLGFGPQIGPEFTKLDNKYEFRRYVTLNGDKKKKTVKLNKPGMVKEVTGRTAWSAISGKYFTVIGITDATEYMTTFSTESVPGQESASRMFFSRPAFKSANKVDTFKFYMGPMSSSELRRYESSETNGFGMNKMSLDKVLDSGAILGWLQAILKWMLVSFHKFIPNYGVAIILLTFVVKLLLYPLTKKSFESSARMSALSPKLKEIQEKYKGNSQKMNAEMSALYRKEGVSPLSGCLPILLQMPIFFALYGLLNSFFELRGAGFLEPWITDLSKPDSIFNFAPASFFFIGSDIRLLPILMAVTQILSSKLMQPASASGGSGQQMSQMKMMTYAMPIIFLFVLYDVSSGLLLYWTMTNIISIGQQLYINHKQKARVKAKA